VAATDQTWNWKQHDTGPAIGGQCTSPDGTPFDCTGATVTFIMKAVGGAGALKINEPATVVDGPTGQVSYSPTAADTDTAGAFQAEFQVVTTSGVKETFPNTSYIAVTITADLDNA
jgi:hypothetical protein